MAKNPTTPPPAQDNQPSFNIERIYTKDLSFESPSSPKIFQEEWQPEIDLQLKTSTSQLSDNIHEVVLSVTVTAKAKEKTLFVTEVQQGGIFSFRNIPADQMHPILGSVCPSMIYPYLREVVSDLVIRGGFPQLVLAPINFDALYAQHVANDKKSSGETAH